MKYLKKFNESNINIESDIDYIMAELIDDYDFKKTKLSYPGKPWKDTETIDYGTDYVQINQEFNDKLINLKKKCDKIGVDFKIYIEYADFDVVGSGVYDINMNIITLEKYLSLYDERHATVKKVYNYNVTHRMTVDYEFCIMFKSLDQI